MFFNQLLRREKINFIWNKGEHPFSLAHIYWAIGGTAGLEGQKIEGVLYIVIIIAIVLCFIAAIVALAFFQSWGRKIPSGVEGT